MVKTSRERGEFESRPFITALKVPETVPGAKPPKKTRIIAEVKQSSPSRGVIKSDFDPAEIAKIYEKHNAAAISVLTVAYGFNGKIDYLKSVAKAVKIPVLRKDFIFEEYQIYEARVFNADAILLIASILEPDRLKDLHDLARSLGLEVLVEVHTREDLEKTIECDPEIIGVNNRDLDTFIENITTTVKLLKYIPEGKVIVSESGIRGREDIEWLENAGINAFLVGTTLMQAEDIGRQLDMLLGKRFRWK